MRHDPRAFATGKTQRTAPVARLNRTLRRLDPADVVVFALAAVAFAAVPGRLIVHFFGSLFHV